MPQHQGNQGRDAERRKELLELAKRLGNISEACRRLNMDRSAYYRALRATEAGLSGPPSRATPKALEQKLVALCVEFPEWGCDRLAYYLTLTGDPISSPTTQKILIRHGLGRAAQRYEAAKRRTPGGPSGTAPA